MEDDSDDDDDSDKKPKKRENIKLTEILKYVRCALSGGATLSMAN